MGIIISNYLYLARSKRNYTLTTHSTIYMKKYFGHLLFLAFIFAHVTEKTSHFETSVL
jgi:hypothetical protein